jgi:glycosyltransferase involved in cell wall biosynthesis
MNVLFLMIAFPDIERNPNLYTDLAVEFKINGHNVFVATVLEKKTREETSCHEESGIKVLRVRCGDLFNVGFIKKGITTLKLPYRFIRAIKKYFKNVPFDLVIYPTPPITFNRVVKYVKMRHRCPAYLILRDIFPQNARDMGLIKNPVLFQYFRKVEKDLYDISDFIGCMSKRNIEYVLEHNRIPEGKCELLPNWKKVRDTDLSPDLDYKTKYGLDNKTVAIFGGEIGIAQELEFLLELAKEYRDREDAVFLIIGEGNRKEKLEEIIARENLTNVIIRGRIDSQEFKKLVHQCDVGLVNLNRNFTIPNFPPKRLIILRRKFQYSQPLTQTPTTGNFWTKPRRGFGPLLATLMLTAEILNSS